MRPLVSVLIERTVPGDVFWRFMTIAQQGWALIPSTYAATDAQLEAVTEAFMADTQFTHLVTLALDHKHPKNCINKLVQHVTEDPGKLVVGILCHRRGEPYDPLAFQLDEHNHMYGQSVWEPGLHQVYGFGPGCTIFAREVFERLGQPYWPISYQDGKCVREDPTFWRRCYTAGIAQWVDTTQYSPHMAIRWIGPQDHWDYMREHRDDITANNEYVIGGGTNGIRNQGT